ncbi:MAG: 4Fe-4S dicluster domain-containing protein [Desulfobacteraceae bacterium]|jgi:NAD-dependent dihydropyrimidine dehydrogenase PreA subunit
MKLKRKIIEIDQDRCNGCGQCVIGCAEGALAIVDGKAEVISDNLCDGLGACIGECPENALQIIEREADAFDEEAVEAHLDAQKAKQAPLEKTMPCGCPSTQIQSFTPRPSTRTKSPSATGEASALSHWPVQIKLVPPHAPFLKGADLLVVADCVPVAFPSLHQELLQGKAIMIGCPKFDDAQEYIEKFAAIFNTSGINSITTVVMEVPCCSGLPMMVQKGREKAGSQLPIDQMVVSTRGQIIDMRQVA